MPFDVFVSYAHVDNEPALSSAPGWVTTFLRTLKIAIDKEVGERVVSLWWDTSDMRKAHDFEQQITGALGNAQMIITLLSEGYFRSEWCMEEQQIFCATHAADLEGRVLAAELIPVEPARRERLAFRNRTAVPFWVMDEANRARRMADPVPLPEDRNYFRRVDDIAVEIARCYRRAPARQAVAPQPAVVQAAPAVEAPLVVIAEATEDLEARRESLVRRLRDAGIGHVALDSYGLSTEEFTGTLDTALKSAHTFVQLLGPVPGRGRPGAPQGLPRLQVEHARLKVPPVRMLQWRDPAIDLTSIEDDGYRAVLMGETVQAVSFDRFRDLVIEALQPAPPPQVPMQDAAGPFLMVNYDSVDQTDFEEIQRQLPPGMTSFGPPAAGTENYRQTLEKRILDAKSMMVVFGQVEPDWIQTQMLSLAKLALTRDKVFEDLIVLRRPPTDRPVPQVRIPGLRVIDWMPGVSLADAGVHFS